MREKMDAVCSIKTIADDRQIDGIMHSEKDFRRWHRFESV